MLARAGFGSRRACEQLIAAGRVTVDGEVAVLGRRVDPDADRVARRRRARSSPTPTLVHWLLNKPAGLRHDRDAIRRAGRRCSSSCPTTPRVFPVGRLDRDTEGLLILTNDGELAQLLTHPSHGVEKEYLAEVEGVPTPGALRRLREGVELDDGPTAPARVRLVQESSDGSERSSRSW